jgi:hypothetical protein
MREKRAIIVATFIVIDLYVGLVFNIKPMVLIGALTLIGIFGAESLTSIFKH